MEYGPGTELLAWYELIQLWAVHATNHGKFEDAEVMLRKAQQVLQKSSGGHDVERFLYSPTLLLFSHVLIQGNSLIEAERMLKEGWRACEQDFGANHFLTHCIKSTLGFVMSVQGRLEKAARLQKSALEAVKAQLGPKHLITIDLQVKLATTLCQRGMLVEAETTIWHMIDWSQNISGSRDVPMLACVHLLACVYGNQERWEEAEKLCQQVMDAYIHMFGTQSGLTLEVMSTMAFLKREQLQYEDALDTSRRCAEGTELLYGAEDARTLHIRNLLKEWTSQFELGKSGWIDQVDSTGRLGEAVRQNGTVPWRRLARIKAGLAVSSQDLHRLGSDARSLMLRHWRTRSQEQ